MKKTILSSVIVALLTLSACAPSPGAVISPTQTAEVSIPTATSPGSTPASTVTALAPTSTPARVASSSADCSSLRSGVSDDFTSITFINWSGRPVNVYFVDNEGLEQLYFELQPGQSGNQVTYVSHAWCVRDKTSNAPLLAVVGEEDEQVATVLRDIQWQETRSIPIASSAPFDSLRAQPLIFHNGRVYTFGGRSVSDERLTNVYFSAIQPEGKLAEWQETTPLPGKYYDHVAVRLGDYVYLLTGAAGADDVYYAPFNADGSLGAWKETAPLSPSRQTFAAASHGNYIYATGGNSGEIKNYVQYTSANPDGSLNPWTHTRPLPEPFQEHTMVAYDGYLYVIGGRTANDNWKTAIYFSAIQPDGTLGDWKTTTPLPPRALHGSGVFESNGYLYLLSDGSAYYTRILESHKLGEWQPITSLPAVRSGLRVGAHNSYAYAIGGYDIAGHQSTVYHSWLGVEHPDCTSGWTRLKSGIYAEVSQDQPLPNRVHEAPDIAAKIIQQLYSGSIVRVLEGPVCKNGLIFWKVENALIPGGAGWTAEGDKNVYWLEPIQ